jgi:hypothetical protein
MSELSFYQEMDEKMRQLGELNETILKHRAILEEAYQNAKQRISEFRSLKENIDKKTNDLLNQSILLVEGERNQSKAFETTSLPMPCSESHSDGLLPCPASSSSSPVLSTSLEAVHDRPYQRSLRLSKRTKLGKNAIL